MPLPEPSQRKHIHTRAIEYKGYLREDGLWDIEGHMTDVKTYGFKNDWRGEMPPGTPLHQMWLRVTIDEKQIIKDVIAVTDNSPFELCPDIAPNYKALIGIRMGPGWRKAIRDTIGGVKGCTHLTEMLFPMATVAFQTIMPYRNYHGKKSDSDMAREERRPMVLDTCHAWAADSPVVKVNAPKYYTGE